MNILKITKRLLNRACHIRKLKKQWESKDRCKVSLKGTALPSISVGRGTYMNGLKVYCWDNRVNITVGRYCSMADEITIVAGGEHDIDWISTYPFIDRWRLEHLDHLKKPRFKGDITIGHDVWIGHGATLLSGVTIGNGAVIAAGALVNKDVEPYSIVGGLPAKEIKKRFDEKTIKKLQTMKWWDWDRKKIEETLELFSDPETFIKRQ